MLFVVGCLNIIAGRAPLGEALEKFRQMATEAGRDPAGIPITAFGATENRDEIRRFRDLGVARTVVSLESDKDDKILPVLDRWAALIRDA